MGIFKKFFSGQAKPGNPDNSKLLRLIDMYWKTEGKGKTYETSCIGVNERKFLPNPFLEVADWKTDPTDG